MLSCLRSEWTVSDIRFIHVFALCAFPWYAKSICVYSRNTGSNGGYWFLRDGSTLTWNNGENNEFWKWFDYNKSFQIPYPSFSSLVQRTLIDKNANDTNYNLPISSFSASFTLLPKISRRKTKLKVPSLRFNDQWKRFVGQKGVSIQHEIKGIHREK